jgi:cysteine desulfurase/selenocysteine lyase
MSRRRIYLDNAATSWPKPEAVYDAVDRYQRENGATAGRGAYRESDQVGREVLRTRQQLVEMIGGEDPCRIIFTANGTESLNLGIQGMLRPGDHVITSAVDHNSVLRPLRFLEEERDVQVTRVACSPTGVIDPADVAAAIQPNTRLIALVHVSNVTGAVQPIEQVGEIARQHGITYLVDAAQSLGHMPLDVRQSKIHLLAAPAHKGLLGPSGLGVLYVAAGCEQELVPLRLGGTGTQSDEDRQPDSLPDKYEPGNLNVPAVLGLSQSLNYLRQRGLDQIREHARQLTVQLLGGFNSIPGVTVHGPNDASQQLGVVSITVAGQDPREVAAILDSAHDIQVRAGIQCAPLMHAALGTTKNGGTIRFSFSAFTQSDEVDAAIAAVREIASTTVPA